MIIRMLLFIILTIYVAGCSNQNTQSNDTPQHESFIEQTSDQNGTATNNEIASHLAKIATEVPDVHDAVAIVAGPYAVVGIDVDEKIDRQRVGTIKFSVNEALRDDPYGKTAVVIADADATERIRNMRNQIQKGEPIQGVVDELADIVGRLMPTFPVEERGKDEIEQEDDTLMEDGQRTNELNERNNINGNDNPVDERESNPE